jgi:hypothetical protein
MAFDLPFGASTLYLEFSSEPPEAIRWGAHVLVNRKNDGRWGDTITSVCLAWEQFSSWDGDRGDAQNRTRIGKVPDTDPVLMQCAAFLQAAMDGEPDPTNGATHYYADSIPAPDWTKGAVFCGKIGRTMFWRDVK